MHGYVMRDSIPAWPADMRRFRLCSLPSITRQCLQSAQTELLRGIRGMLGRTLRIEGGVPAESAIVVGTVEQVRTLDAGFDPPGDLQADAYALISTRIRGQNALVITGATDRAVLVRGVCVAEKDRAGRKHFCSQRSATAVGADTLGQPVGQPGWLDRAGLRGTVDLLREPQRAPGPDACDGVREIAGVGRHQWMQRQQRER